MKTVPPNALSVIDALTAHIALLNIQGDILAVNQAWKNFADANGSKLAQYGLGCNYVGMLSQLADTPSENDRDDCVIASAVVTGIKCILDGHSDRFQIEYPCHAPWEQRWFLLTVTPYPPGSEIRAVVSHENITPLKQAEQRAKDQGSRLIGAFSSMIEAIALAIEKRDPYTAGHQHQVAALAVEIGRRMSLDEEQLFGLHLGATIHDIGKIAIPAEILNRPGELTEPEFAIIRYHPAIGYDILRGIDFPWPIADMVHQHHERLDGSGYPQHLTAPDICLEARIIAVADVFDAIISHRPYRPGRNLSEALDELKKGRGRSYDADVIDAGLSFFSDVGADWHRQHRCNAEDIHPLSKF